METRSLNIIGRRKEKDEFSRIYHSGRNEFAVVYGRRRIGKTYLVENLFRKEFSFHASGVLGGDFKQQMHSFSKALEKYGYKGENPKNWMDAFDCLGSLLDELESEERCVVFIDEMPCLDTPKAGFLPALNYFWNTIGASRSNLLFIVCGSATSWIVNNILDDHGGLHNRVTRQIHLSPFTLGEIEEYAKSNGSFWSRLNLLQMYSVIGGVPYYWNNVDYGLSPAENIDRLFFSEDPILGQEYSRLYSSLFRNPVPYLSVIENLAAKQSGLTRGEISSSTGIPTGLKLTRVLADLENCDFIRSFDNRKNSRVYQLVDFFSLFFLKYRNHIGTRGWWSRANQTSIQNVWYGLSFEKICLCHSRQIEKALHLDTIQSSIFSWRSRELSAQIDLVIDRADSVATICEIKYSAGEYCLDKDEYLKVMNRLDAYGKDLGKGKGLQLVFITTFGLVENSYSHSVQRQLVLDDIFDND